MAAFYPLTVKEVRPETRDAVVVSLGVPDEHAEAFRFRQGQYLTFRAQLDGEEVRRSYSICSAVQDGDLRVGIKKVKDGWFSRWANESLKAGDTIEAMPPAGNFFVPLDPANRKHYVGFAGGSGITPILGIVKTTLLAEPHSRFTLFYGNEASSTILFREELEDLKNVYMQRFNLVHILNREHQDIELFNGMMTKEKCNELFTHWIDLSDVDTAFICGPQQMMLQIAEALQEHGLDRRQIKFELFSSPAGGTRRKPQPAAASETSEDRCEATVVIDGRARTFSMAKKAETVLDAGLREGMELPYACKGGVCSTCRAMLLEGEVDMDANFALEDYEIARGYILTCQSYPATDKVVVDYDK
jgi:ring-1,2-phenylacetyl-CoA epoxidase subunit PaaE